MSILFKIVSESIDAEEKEKRKKAYEAAKTNKSKYAAIGAGIGGVLGGSAGAYDSKQSKSYLQMAGLKGKAATAYGTLAGAGGGAGLGATMADVRNLGVKSGAKGHNTSMKKAIATGALTHAAAAALASGGLGHLVNKSGFPIKINQKKNIGLATAGGLAAGALNGYLFKKGQDAGRKAREELN